MIILLAFFEWKVSSSFCQELFESFGLDVCFGDAVVKKYPNYGAMI